MTRWVISLWGEERRLVMIKRKIRYCDRCGAEMPKELDVTPVEVIPYDILNLGRRVKNSQMMSVTKDICQPRMVELDEFLRTKPN
jgi:hypothetical protein